MSLNNVQVIANNGGKATGINVPIQFPPETLEPIQIRSWHLPGISDYFVPREALLDEICKKIETSIIDDTRLVTLSALKGMGGVGKTTLAAYFIQSPYMSACPLRIWFNAESVSILEKEYRGFGLHCQLFTVSDNLPISVAKERVKAYLEKYANQVFVVYDNAEKYDEFKDFLPQRVPLLVTSRSQFWPSKGLIDVDVMTVAEARDLFKNITKTMESEVEIDKLTSTLGWLPLGIAQAAAFIVQTTISITDYLNDYEQNELELLADETMPIGDETYIEEDGNKKVKTVAITWKVSIKKVREKSSEAIILQEACAFMDGTGIPENILSEYMAKKGIVGLRYHQAKQALKNYSLISCSETIIMHRLVQDVVRWNMSSSEKKSIALALLNIFFALLKEDEHHVIIEQNTLFIHFNKLLLHILKMNEANLEFIMALNRGAVIHLKTVSYASLSQAIIYFDKALELCDKNTTRYVHAMSLLLNDLGVAYLHFEDKVSTQKALECHHKALDLQLQDERLDETHLKVAKTYNNLGNVYLELEKLEEAITYYKKARKTYKLYPQNQAIGLILNNLGKAYMQLQTVKGRDKAISYYKKALKTYGDQENVEIARVLNNLGVAYQDFKGMENYEKAETYLGRALTMRRKLLGKEHPDVAFTLNNLGVTYQSLLKHDGLEKAVACYNEALEIYSKRLDKSHPAVAMTSRNLGQVYLDFKGKNNLKEAIFCFKQAIRVLIKNLGENHPDTAKVFNQLGLAYFFLQTDKSLEVAIIFHEQAWRSCDSASESKGSENTSSYRTKIWILTSLANAHRDLGKDFNKALKYYMEALSIGKELENVHDYLAWILKNQGILHYLMGPAHFDKAIANYESALKLGQKSLEPEGLEIGLILQSLGIVYFTLGETPDIEKAISYLKQALQIQNSFLRKTHPDTAVTLYYLGYGYLKRGRREEIDASIAFLSKSLKYLQEELTTEHRVIQKISLELSQLKETLLKQNIIDVKVLMNEIENFKNWGFGHFKKKLPPLIWEPEMNRETGSYNALDTMGMTFN